MSVATASSRSNALESRQYQNKQPKGKGSTKAPRARGQGGTDVEDSAPFRESRNAEYCASEYSGANSGGYVASMSLSSDWHPGHPNALSSPMRGGRANTSRFTSPSNWIDDTPLCKL